nr:1,2-phenylacetyl-CoA epoxidase subunit PaaD [Phaeacidiphilus oryzae]
MTAPAELGRERAVRIASAVPDPELPFLTLADLGVLRGIGYDPEAGEVTVELTPTYLGCPAVAEMRAVLDARLRAAGFPRVEVRTVLSPPWTPELISAEGRRKLAEHGIAPPVGSAESAAGGPVPLRLGPTRHRAAAEGAVDPVRCPRCGSAETVETSAFGAAPCRSLWRCESCLEPFEHIKSLPGGIS